MAFTSRFRAKPMAQYAGVRREVKLRVERRHTTKTASLAFGRARLELL
jgi:hypothetical protein